MLEINLEPRLAAGEGWTERQKDIDKERGRKKVEQKVRQKERGMRQKEK